MEILIKESQYKFLVEQVTPTTPPTPLSREEQIKINKEKLEQRRKASEELKSKMKQQKDSLVKAYTEKRAPELAKANALHRKYVDDWLSANPGKTEKDYSNYLTKQSKKPDIGIETQDPNFNSKKKCGIAKAGDRQNKSDWSKK